MNYKQNISIIKKRCNKTNKTITQMREFEAISSNK